MTELAAGLVSATGFSAALGSRGRRMSSQKITNNTTISALGLPAPTATGAPTRVVGATGEYNTYPAASGGSCGLSYNTDIQTQTLPLLHVEFFTPADLTNLRAWVGLFLADPATSDDPATHLAGFRYSNGVDTNWMACTKDAVTLNAQSTGIAVAVSSRYDLSVVVNNSLTQIVFFINGVPLIQSVASLPGNTQNLDTYIRGRDKGTATPIVNVGWAITNLALP